VKFKSFTSVLSERVRLNNYIPLVEYVFIARHVSYFQVVQLKPVSSNS